MPNGPIKEIAPTKEEINEFAEKYDLKFEITDPSGEFPPHLGNGSHIVRVDLNIVDWASVISQTSILKEIDIFEKAHPDIKIKLKIIGWRSAHEEILKAASKKKYPHPDALQMPSIKKEKLSLRMLVLLYHQREKRAHILLLEEVTWLSGEKVVILMKHGSS